jgi:Fur family ferric uptake transcriptional regulator
VRGPSVHGPSAHDWRDRLREQGYRITVQRELVFEAVRTLGHSTPDELLKAVTVKDPGVNLSTIYRTLDVLEEVGLVRHSHLGHGSPTYHAADHDPHLHLVCSRCHGVEEVPVETANTFVGTLHERWGFSTDMEHFAIHGVCRTCSVGSK